jgi:hypothetical protein
MIAAHGEPVGQNANWLEKDRFGGGDKKVGQRKPPKPLRFPHDSGKDWRDGDRPEVGMLLGWKRLRYRYDTSLPPLLRNG